MKHLDLFSGIGGFALAAKWAGFTTIGFCEIDPWCQRVLAKNFPGVPIHDDIKTLTAATVREWLRGAANGSPVGNEGTVGANTANVQRPSQQRHESDRVAAMAGSDTTLDLITAGYPCQPFSHAGKRLGAQDDRHLWPALAALVAELRPRWCLFENVAGHISMGLDDVLADLETLNYTCWPVVIPACAVNAPHRRDRVWLVAHAACEQFNGRRDTGTGRRPESTNSSQDAADADRRRCRQREPQERAISEFDQNGDVGHADLSLLEGQRADWLEVLSARHQESQPESPGLGVGDAWAVEPDVGRVAHGIPKRVDRLRGLGNAIVPQVAYVILSAMMRSSTTLGQ